MARARRDTAKYRFTSQTGKPIRSGITNRPLEKRLAELRREENAPRGRIEQVGRRTTYPAARKWEDQQPDGTPPGG